MPSRLPRGRSTLPEKSASKPAMMRKSVVLPHPEGPTSAPASPRATAKRKSAMTFVFRPSAPKNSFEAMSTSSSILSPARDAPLEGLHDKGFDAEHQRHEGQRIGEQHEHVEELEGRIDLEADPVRAAQELDDQHDLPDERKPRARRRGEIRRKLRQHDMAKS